MKVAGLRLDHDLPVLVPKPDPVCLDIGANQGQTIALFQRAFRNPMIHAFEPSTQTFAHLKSKTFGTRVVLHNLALGDKAGRATFHNYESSDLSSLLELNKDPTESVFGTEQEISQEVVEIDTVDAFRERAGLAAIDVLKIDTQGFDLQVLHGSAETLKSNAVRVVVVELNFVKLYEAQSEAVPVIQYLQSHGFKLVDFYEKQRRSRGELGWVTGMFLKG